MKTILIATLTGFIVGLVFAFLKLPIPAPPAFAGIAGIIGIYLGFKAYDWLSGFLSL
ncbi:XapX domain-containing protein [Bacillus sp. NTK071]|uniref:XapX domain-containing protein n=1 Tax=Bacillus sp. NTK071 TaxID=2802175 RepID=UPI001A8FEE41|nr:XapX domain-containing protein [Bacillus sp. NTK071]MBN8208658.1 XapX domain-containing protein [Bacillus sp. NTK071]